MANAVYPARAAKAGLTIDNGQSVRETIKPQLKPLTGLRFIAALLVVMFHFLPLKMARGVGGGYVLDQMTRNIVNSGYIGVNFFFILSGFILAYNYLDANGQLRIPWGEFWVARFARIYPAYWLALVIALVPFLHAYASASITRALPHIA